ncbi:MAG TPA: DUF2007 domain-containing protein [Anaerolineae bacterium]|jgi:hypothetical protein
MLGILKGHKALAASTHPGDQEPIKWVVIAIVGWGEAEVIHSKLESVNIPCLLQREAAGAVFGITFGPMGEVRVLVPESLAEEALDVIGDNEADNEGDEVMGENLSENDETG